MTGSGMETVLWISAVGMTLLMLALGGLVGLMYLMTSPLLGRAADAVSPHHAASEDVDGGERERRQRAAVLAVAIACAEATTPVVQVESASEWRRMHRAARLRSGRVRKGLRP